MSKKRKSKRVTVSRVKTGKGRVIAVIALMAMLSVTGLLVAHRASLWGTTPTAAPQPMPSLAKEYIYAGGKLVATEEPAGSPPAAPAAPSSLAATAVSSSQINLTWVDTSGNEDGFKIERKTGGDNYAQIATVGANATSYPNTGLTASTTYYYRVRAYNVTGDSAYSNEANATTGSSSSQTPYGGTAWPVPGTIQVEDFDNGGEGVAYHDLSPLNDWGFYRPSEAVDIYWPTSDAGGGYIIGNAGGGEWLEYTVNITTAGTYNIETRIASNGTGGIFHIEFNGVDKTGLLSVPNTGGWDTWQTVTKTNVSLSAGQQVMRLALDSNGPSGAVANFNYITITSGGSGGCSYSINPTSQSFASGGGTGSVSVTAGAGCAWTATSNASWITITSGSSGSGNGTVNYSVASNSGAARNGTMTIAGQTFTVSQSAGGGGGGSGTGLTGGYFSNMILSGSPGFSRVDATVDFNWGTGTPGAPLSIDNFSIRWTGQVEAQFSESYTFHVFSDDGFRLWVNGQLLLDMWFDQFGPEVASSPISLTAGQRYDIKVEYYENFGGAEIHLKWSSPSTTKQTIPQSRLYPTTGGGGCSFSINPTSQSFASGGGTGSVSVTAGTGCNWTVTNTPSWITITSGSSGSGNGTVNYSVASNSGAARNGTMTIAGQTFTVNQDAAGGSCVTAISPTSRTFSSFGGNSTVTVTASGCSWTAVSNASWITITTSMPKTGSTKVQYFVASNSGTCRVGTITIGSFTHTVTQSGSAGSCP